MNKEAEKFEKLGDEWWDPKGRLFSLHRINPLRFAYFADKAGKLEGRTVLDIGCGGGLLSESFASAGSVVTGIDLSPVTIEVASRHAEKSGLRIDYRVTSVGDLLKVLKRKTPPFLSILRESPRKARRSSTCSSTSEQTMTSKGGGFSLRRSPTEVTR